MQKEIEKNIELLKSRVSEACSSVELESNNISVIAVSKRKSTDHIKAAFNAGIINFGENYAQELQQKCEELNVNDIVWHFIGPIQSNKVKLISRHANWVHSIDRLSIAEKINKECALLNKTINACIQVNISEEETKSGIASSELLDFASHIDSLDYINLKGIMVLPKISGNATKEMVKSKLIHDELVSFYPKASYLSMGTTSDFETAIELGSNMIRVGELIFGERD